MIDVFAAELDLAELGFSGVDPEVTGRPSYHPSVLLKLYIYGYLNRVQSSRHWGRRPVRELHPHLVLIIQRIAARVGRRIDEASPMVDARLPDGSRVNATLPPVTIDGPTLSIRRFGRRRLSRDDLIRLGCCRRRSRPPSWIWPIRSHKNILISGGTGAGKTTFLGAMAEAIRAHGAS